ncbi:MAG: hypothetical protein NBV76_05325 [Candidatus Ochrobactrum gambitense]|nr:MAG: hypothetical protein NBV76_05325 [Candidatus Ochrobactrum gambitense]WEK17207.1 MAG: helix-turn-helix domain-containing protein [Candidatus Ochrobactrum gambitense]
MYARSYRTEANPRYQAAVAEQRRREQARLEEKKRQDDARRSRQDIIDEETKLRLDAERQERENLKQAATAKRTAETLAKYREIVVGKTVQISVRDIITVAVEGTSFTYDDVVCHRRTRTMTNVRHYAILCAWAFRTDLSLPQLGKFIGGRDHTTILHATGRFGFESRQEAAVFIKEHGRQATIARLSKQAA